MGVSRASEWMAGARAAHPRLEEAGDYRLDAKGDNPACRFPTEAMPLADCEFDD
jgi:hypothetical protein